MRRVNLLGAVGVAMLAGGVALFLSDNSFLPLWVIWIVGPLLWYFGFAVMLVWGYQQFFVLAAQSEPAEAEPAPAAPVRRQEVIRLAARKSFGAGPAGVIHEIPAMGGFIL